MDKIRATRDDLIDIKKISLAYEKAYANEPFNIDDIKIQREDVLKNNNYSQEKK